MTFVRGMDGFYGRILDSSTKCRRYGALILQLTSDCSVVLFRIKRFRRTKHSAEFIWSQLKRFRGTKLPEDCRLWPAAYEVERIAPAWRTGPHGPAGRRTWDPFHIICSMSMVSRATAKLMKHHKIRKVARSFAKPCHYKACRHL